MAGPMAYLAPGKRSVTACAITCAVEWRSTSRPSAESGVTIATGGVVVDRAVEIDPLAVDRGRERGLGQAPADRRRDVAGGDAAGRSSRVEAVGQRDRDRAWAADVISGPTIPAAARLSLGFRPAA